ncbi:MAG: hypothetical protein HQ546_06330, partial [Planctomycetes bacterium]|nr:hypothetical protein [Planctomycetota bacterium]
MGCFLGIDIGAVSIQAAVLAKGSAADRLTGSALIALRAPLTGADGQEAKLWVSAYRRTYGRPAESAVQLLDEIIALVGSDDITALAVAGSGGEMVARKLGVVHVNEFKAVAAAAAVLAPQATVVFEMGGETSKFLQLRLDGPGAASGIVDYQTNGDCAAGTGSFLDQQAGRLHYDVADIGQIVADADRAAQVAGRCSVFAKSDMIHAQQKGYTPPEVLRGLCNAVARNFRSAVVRSRKIPTPVAFIGGVAANSGVVAAMREVFGLGADELFVPAGYAHFVAVGAALLACRSCDSVGVRHIRDLREARDTDTGRFPTTAPLGMHRVRLLRDQVAPYALPLAGRTVDVTMGIDVGSVSTNVVLLDNDGNVVKEIYMRTKGRPIEVVSEALLQIRDELGDRVRIIGAGTTGSGRELIGELVGADTVNDEITCHKTGACFVGTRMIGRIPDTIFEIGGQDSKYISIADGVVVDFTMNEACAAGTGSFLEERAEELKIAIKDEFAEKALASPAPIRLGERCTVFMERDVNSYMQRGADTADLVAGLAYSIAYNYINRVVRGRKIGDCIFFQGGTAYNDAVAAAFASILDKEIIVPPYNGVVGAIGAALLAREKMTRSAGRPPEVGQSVQSQQGTYLSVADGNGGTRFRGYEMDKVDYRLREFTCKGCSNACAVQEFNVEGEKTYWGDKCSDRFRKRTKTDRKAVVSDLEAFRRDRLMDESNLPAVPGDAPVVGIPLSMYCLERLPFFRAFFAHCGFRTILSEPTNRKIIEAGLDAVVAEPCFPIIVAHGHVADLIARDVDYILVPSVLNAETAWMDNESHSCPWGQTLPYVIRRSPAFASVSPRQWLSPVLQFRQGRDSVRRQLRLLGKQLGVKPQVA